MAWIFNKHTNKTTQRGFYLFLFLIACVCTHSLYSQPTSLDTTTTLPKIEDIDGQLKQIQQTKANTTDEAQIKQLDSLAAILESVRNLLAGIKKQDDLLAGFQKSRVEAPDRLASIQKESAELDQADPLTLSDASPIDQIEQQLSLWDAQLTQARQNVTDLENETKFRTQRRVELPQLIAQEKEQLDQIKKQPLPPVNGDSGEITAARKALQRASLTALQRKIETLNEEIASYDARRDLLTARREYAARRVNFYEQRTKTAQELLTKKKKLQAEQAALMARQTQKETAQSHPLIRQLAEENARLAQLSTGPKGLITRNAALTDQRKQVDAKLYELNQEFKGLKDKVQAAGLTDVIGVILMGRRDNLPDVRQYQRRLQTRKREIADAWLDRITYDERLTHLTDINKAVDDALDDADIPATERTALAPEVEQLLKDRRTFLKNLLDEHERVLGTMADLDVQERQLILVIQAYTDYINEHVLWVKSAHIFSYSFYTRCLSALQWLIAPPLSRHPIDLIWQDVKTFWWSYGIAALLLILLAAIRGLLIRNLQAICPHLHQKYTDHFSLTLKTLFYTMALSLSMPIILLFIAFRLKQAGPDSEYAAAMAAGLQSAGLTLLALNFLKQICRDRGLAISHFRLPKPSITLFRRHLIWLTGILVITTFIWTTLDRQSINTHKESLASLALLAEAVAFTLFFAKVLYPSGDVIKLILKRLAGGWLDRMKWLLFLLLFLLPISLAIITALGYNYGAYHLTACLHKTLLLILALLLGLGVLRRWSIVTQMKLAIRQARQRLISPENDSTHSDEHTDPADIQPCDDSETPDQINVQTRRLLNTLFCIGLLFGLWIIWADMLPALGIFGKINLWTSTSPNGPVAITLADGILAILILFFTFIISRSILGLLEIVILQRLPLDQGVRFAIIALSRYVIVIVGVILAFTQIGIGWAKVQWLAAAVTVGLGFGLQEIFANFVSGLIILFEQPMRVGDTVTVGDISGKVTRIRIRATTIRKWDRKELVVPNREFVTGRLINWTLTDTILRMDFPVGIAYGSDTALAEKTLRNIADRHPKVLADPEPVVIFKGFGDSSLEFELKVYIPDLDSYLDVWHQINLSIDDAFRKAGIEIAFPQRDIHIRSIHAPLPIQRNPLENK